MTATETLEMSQIQHALATSSQPQLRQLIAVETDEHILVSGRVPSYYLKSMAIETVKVAAGDRRMVLSIDVEN